MIAPLIRALVAGGVILSASTNRPQDASDASDASDERLAPGLTLSTTTVRPGEVVTCTVTGTLVGTVLLLEELSADGSWQPLYFLSLWSRQDPERWAREPFFPFRPGGAFLVGWQLGTFQLRIPPVPTDTYRISLDKRVMIPVELHATITVTDF